MFLGCAHLNNYPQWPSNTQISQNLFRPDDVLIFLNRFVFCKMHGDYTAVVSASFQNDSTTE